MLTNLRIVFNNLHFLHVLNIKRVIEKSYVHLSATVLAKENDIDSDIKIPDPPTNCCMSGCANCVWILYAEELAKLFKDGGKKSREIIIDKVDDPNMKAFLLTELRFLESKKS